MFPDGRPTDIMASACVWIIVLICMFGHVIPVGVAQWGVEWLGVSAAVMLGVLVVNHMR